MKNLPLCFAVVAALAVPGALSAQTAAAPATTAPATATTAAPTATAAASAVAPSPSMSAQQFVTEAASGGMFEVDSSKLALTKAKSDDVKAFAQMMIDDHTKANEELTALAKAKSLDVPATITGMPADHMKAVEAAADGDFDATYMQHQIEAHHATIKLFEAEAASSNDADLAAFAKKTLPALIKHAEHAATVKP